jgi:hypothetical protein
MTTQVPPQNDQPENLLVSVDVNTLQSKKSNWKLPVLFIGIVIGILCLCSFLAGSWLLLIQRGVAEVSAMEPWPDPEIPSQDLVTVDLSHLGLEVGQLKNARDEETWAGGGYKEGSMITYQAHGQDVVGIWVLRYETKQAAGDDFGIAQAWASQLGNCGMNSYAFLGNRGVVHCRTNNGYDKIFWNDYWIVDIVALDGTDLTSDVLVDKVRDAISAHWKVIAQSSE